MPRAPALILAASLLAGAACRDGHGPISDPVAATHPLAVRLDPRELTIREGLSDRLAVVLERDGEAVTDTTTVSWISRNPAVAAVSADGGVVATAGGRTWVVARAGGAVDSVPVHVTVRYTEIHAGSDATCARSSVGRLYCWGWNADGQLGNGTFIDTTLPVAVGGLSAPSLSSGSGTSCAVSAPGLVWCWGFNGVGQLGDGTQDPRASPIALSESLAIDRVALGAGTTTCAASGTVWYCWGWNRYNQTLDGPSGVIRYTPVRLNAPATLTTVVPGGGHVCALDSTGAVWCWGRNDVQQAGAGPDAVLAPQRLDMPAPFIQLVAGETHSCGRATDGRVWCWGGDSYGQSSGTPSPGLPAPHLAFGGTPLDTLTTSRNTTCGLAAGAPICWGRDDDRQATGGNALRFAQISTGLRHTCGITTDGVAMCWGANPRGALGNGSRRPAGVPVPVAYQP